MTTDKRACIIATLCLHHITLDSLSPTFYPHFTSSLKSTNNIFYLIYLFERKTN